MTTKRSIGGRGKKRRWNKEKIPRKEKRAAYSVRAGEMRMSRHGRKNC